MIFAVIEGADAVGKHTQSERLRDKLVSLAIDTQLISFPRYGTQIGQALLSHLKRRTLLIDVEKAANKIVDTPAAADSYLRSGDFTHPDDPLAFQALMVMDKYDEAPAIVQALRQGKAVVSDRWWHSAQE